MLGPARASSRRSRARTIGTAPVTAADPVDDRAQDIGKFRADDEKPFSVGLRGCDLQERDEFTGAGQSVLDQAVVAEFLHFLNPNAGVPEDFDDRPSPEGVLFVSVEQSLVTRFGVLRPDVVRVCMWPIGTDESLPGGAELVTGRCCPGGRQHRVGVVAPLVRGTDQHREHGQPLPGPGIHACFSSAFELSPGEVLLTDGAWSASTYQWPNTAPLLWRMRDGSSIRV